MIIRRHSYRCRTGLGLHLGSQRPRAAHYQGSQGVFIDLRLPHYSHPLRHTPLHHDPSLLPLKSTLPWRGWASEMDRRRKPALITMDLSSLGRCFHCREALLDSDRRALPLKTVSQSTEQSWSKAILVLDLQLEYSCSAPLRHFPDNTRLESVVIFLAPYMAYFPSLLKLLLLRPVGLPFLNLFTGMWVHFQSFYDSHECLVLQNEDWYHLH